MHQRDTHIFCDIGSIGERTNASPGFHCPQRPMSTLLSCYKELLKTTLQKNGCVPNKALITDMTEPSLLIFTFWFCHDMEKYNQQSKSPPFT